MPVRVIGRRCARPNVVWISIEDTSPDLGCYGDTYAKTPVLDAFAKQSVRFDRAFTHAGVCAPSRSGIITGMYPTSMTTQHMRCQGVPETHIRCFTEYLREAGYYCTNNVKTDYQFKPPITAWDENSNKAHWRGKAKNQPFFAVFNYVNTHESQIRDPSAENQKLVAALKPEEKHDPALAVLPPYYPDTPAVRRDWANYYDNVTATEAKIAAVLKQLDDDGLTEETIVWFWGDHGRGLPRGKRWLYDSGTRIPLLIRVPEKWRKHAAPSNPERVAPGSVEENLTAAIDFAPTMLSLCGVEIPKHLHGQAFLGPKTVATPRKFVYGAA
ncbi:MAG: sulfatase [Pirellulales bacterium]